MFLEAVRKACTQEFGHEIVGESTRGGDAVALILRTKPDLVILDLTLPDIDGFNIAAAVLAELPTLRILVLSSHCDDYTLFRIEQSKVHGFVDKNANTLATLREALAALEEGKCYYSAAFYAAKAARRADPRSFVKILSDRERAILCLIGEGLNDEEIGERLQISARTASTHRSNILRKLEIRNTPKLIAFAHEHGFTQVPVRRGMQPVYV